MSTAPVGVASFSSSGPTVDGRQKPDLIAPAVDIETAWPGRAADGTAQVAPFTGTSAAAAEVAALAVRLRVDRPELGPRGVQSLLVQGAQPVAGVPIARQGAGLVAQSAPVDASLRIEPAIVASSHPHGRGARPRCVLHDLGGAPGRYTRLAAHRLRRHRRGLARDGEARPRHPGRAGRCRAGVRASWWCATSRGRRSPTRRWCPSQPAATPAGALGRPEVTVGPRFAEVRVRLGALRRADARLSNVKLHGLRLELVPAGGGAALPVAGEKQSAAWAAGTYRFLVARRLASGLQAPAGRYRLRARAVGPDGTALTSTSESFRLR